MKCIYVSAKGHWDGAGHAIESAVRFSGCPVYYLSDADCGQGQWLDIRKYSEYTDELDRKYGHLWDDGPMCRSMLYWNHRWLAILSYMEKHPDGDPIYCPDWDVLVFQPLVPALSPFMGHLGASSKIGLPGQPEFWQNIHLLESIKPLVAFRDEILRRCDSGTCRNFSDMEVWTDAILNQKLDIADLNVVSEGSYFDPSITYDPGRYYGLDQFAHEPPSNNDERFGIVPSPKIVRWINGKPHFIWAKTWDLVKANVIHCWLPYKGKTRELLDHAISGYTS